MNQVLRSFFLISGVFFLSCFTSRGNHIVGGEIAVTYNGIPNSFHIKLNFYRDCNSGTAFDNSIEIGIYDLVTNVQQQCVTISSFTSTSIALGNACYTPTGLCVQLGTYETDVSIPSNPHGYYVSWGRCCRNTGITNLSNPLNAANEFYAEIPDPSLGNSTPVFSSYPAAYWCAGQTNVSDLSAKDADGDSLVYSLVTPLNGNTTSGNSNSNCSDPGSYSNVIYQAPYTVVAPLGPTSTCYINAANGFITVNPQNLGLFVVSVEVREYRKSDGKYLGQVRRDVQYDVLACTAFSAYPDTTVCSAGSPVQMNASGGISYSWSPSTGLSATNISNPIATPVNSTIYTVTITTAGGCTTTANVAVTINTLPVITASGAAICSGASVNLTAGGASTYIWNPSSGLSSGTGTSVSANPTSTTTYTITGTDVYGCSNTKSVTVTVSGTAPTITGSNATICNGNSATLNAGGASAYFWSPSSGLSSATIGNPVANPSSSTTYTVTGTATDGCTNTKAITVTVNAPTIVINGTTSICSGNSTTLSVSGTSTGYSWSPAAGLSATTGSSVTANPSSTTTYTVTGTDGNGCTNSGNVTVSVFGTGSLTSSGNTTICRGDTTTFSVGGASAYIWTGGSGTVGTSGPTGISVKAYPLTTTTYTVTGYFLPSGCTGTATITINVTGPTATISAGGIVCKGASTTLSASGGISYSWGCTPSTACGLSSYTGAPVTVTPTNTGLMMYTVTATDVNGCTASATDTVTVFSLPVFTPSITFKNDSLFASPYLSTLFYQWYKNSVVIVGGTRDTLALGTDTIGTFSVDIMNSNGCGKTANRVLPIELVSFNAVYNGKTVDLIWSTASEINNDYFTVEKTKDGMDFSFVVNVKGAGNSDRLLYYYASDENPLQGVSAYRLKQTDFDGKYSYSRMVPVNIQSANPLEIVTLISNFRENTLQYLIANNNYHTLKIDVMDYLGRIIFTKSSAENYGEIGFSDFAHGIYVFRVSDNSEFSERKFAY